MTEEGYKGGTLKHAPRAVRILAVGAIVLTTASLIAALIPFGIEYLATAEHYYGAAFLLSSASILLTVISLFLLWRKKSGRRLVACTLIACLVAIYVNTYAQVALFHELPRSKNVAECVLNLHMLHMAVVDYGKTHGKYPVTLEDVPSTKGVKRDWRSPGSNEHFVLWPNGRPTNPPGGGLPADIIVAAELGPNQESAWVRILMPMPTFKSHRPSEGLGRGHEPPDWARTALRIVEAEIAIQERLRGQLFGVRCSGPLHVTGRGIVVWRVGAEERQFRVQAGEGFLQ